MALAISALAFVGCTQEFNPEGRIILITRQEGSGSRSAFLEGVFGRDYTEIVLPENSPQTSTANVHARVASDPQAIGFDSLGHLQGRQGARFLSINGIAPTVATVQNGTYPMSRPLKVVHRQEDDLSPAAQEFARFLTSSQAQEIISTRGYVARSDRDDAFVPNMVITGNVVITGSTSVLPLMQRLEEAFEAISNVTLTVTGGGSGAGRNAVRDGNAVFGMVSAPVTASQITDMSRDFSVTYTVVADDAIAVIVNDNNPRENITIAQLQNIFNANAETRYTHWYQLG